MITNKITGLLILLFIISAVFAFPQDGENNVNISDQVNEATLSILDAENQEVVDRSSALNTFSVWDFVRMLVVLAGVLGFIYLIFFLLKKAGSPKIVSDSTIKILSTQNLETGRSLHLIGIGPQIFLIGSGESSVQLISEIKDKETIDTIKLDESVRNDDNKTFTDTFKGLFKSDHIQKNQSNSSQIGFIRKQRERLRKM